MEIAEGKKYKSDVSKNSENLERVINFYKKQDNLLRKYPLRINKNTVIYVIKEKCNKEYAEKYRKKLQDALRNYG